MLRKVAFPKRPKRSKKKTKQRAASPANATSTSKESLPQQAKLHGATTTTASQSSGSKQDDDGGMVSAKEGVANAAPSPGTTPHADTTADERTDRPDADADADTDKNEEVPATQSSDDVAEEGTQNVAEPDGTSDGNGNGNGNGKGAASQP